MNWRPVSYPNLSGNVVETINALLSRDCPIEITNGEAKYSILPFAAPDSCASYISIRIEAGGATLDVHLSRGTLDAVLMDLLSLQAFEALDEDLQFTVLETALAEPIGVVARALRTPVILTAILAIRHTDPTAQVPNSSGDAPRNLPQRLLFEIRLDSDTSLFVVEVDINAGLPESAGMVLNDSTAVRRRDFSGLPAPVVFELGSAALSAADLVRLEPGDIVLFDECYVDGGKPRISVCGRTIRHVEVNGVDMSFAPPPGHDARVG